MNSTLVSTSAPAAPQAQASKCPIHRVSAWWKTILGGAATVPTTPPAEAATGRCPYAHHFKDVAAVASGAHTPDPESSFIEKAARDAAAAEVHVGDPEAAQLLEGARQMIYHWPRGFGGFSAQLTYMEKGRTFSGQLTARSSRSFDLALPADLEVKNLRFQLEELLAHREAPAVSKMASRTGVIFGDTCPIYGPKLVFVGDRMKSYYRVRDGRITQIARSYGGLSFVINLDGHQECDGRFAASHYTAFYFSADDGRLVKTETFLDSYGQAGEVWLPVERRMTVGDAGGASSSSLRLTGSRLLAGASPSIPSISAQA